MTRYLPIRKEEFDLRSHIESSGHTIETCDHVILTEKICKGYLVKMGGKIKSWKKRWFVFDRMKRTFSYYGGKYDEVSPFSFSELCCAGFCVTCRASWRFPRALRDNAFVKNSCEVVAVGGSEERRFIYNSLSLWKLPSSSSLCFPGDDEIRCNASRPTTSGAAKNRGVQTNSHPGYACVNCAPA